MQYIVFDLEFNQYCSTLHSLDEKMSQCPFEIIQIGALKLDINYNTLDTFNRYIKPILYPQISPFISELTGITTEQLLLEALFPDVYNEYMEFIGKGDTVFCTWGMSDMKELFRNVEYHHLDKKRLPNMYINIQPYASKHLDTPPSKLLSLQAAVELLKILTPYEYHNALYDAYYTAEIFKKVNFPTIQPKRYDPNFVIPHPRQPKKVIDYEKLILQFEKMYARELNKEEQDMIMLAYKMGKTNQFLK